MRRERKSAAKEPVSATRAAEIFISTSSEEADKATKLHTNHNITTYAGEALT